MLLGPASLTTLSTYLQETLSNDTVVNQAVNFVAGNLSLSTAINAPGALLCAAVNNQSLTSVASSAVEAATGISVDTIIEALAPVAVMGSFVYFMYRSDQKKLEQSQNEALEQGEGYINKIYKIVNPVELADQIVNSLMKRPTP